MTLRDEIAQALREAGEPLSVPQIAAALDADLRECDAALWQDPQLFLWQPGHRWTVASPKSRGSSHTITDIPDARSEAALAAAGPQDLRATTLSSGVVLTVNKRPLDSDAFFSVRSAGNTISLTLNSTHELFTAMPTPFETSEPGADYKALCEVLLSAWALYEDSLPGGSTKRANEDARLLWGRRVVEMLRESDGA